MENYIRDNNSVSLSKHSSFLYKQDDANNVKLIILVSVFIFKTFQYEFSFNKSYADDGIVFTADI